MLLHKNIFPYLNCYNQKLVFFLQCICSSLLPPGLWIMTHCTGILAFRRSHKALSTLFIYCLQTEKKSTFDLWHYTTLDFKSNKSNVTFPFPSLGIQKEGNKKSEERKREREVPGQAQSTVTPDLRDLNKM